MKVDPFEVTYEPLAGCTVGNLWRLFAENKFRVSPLGYARALYCVLLTGVISPFNVIDRLLYDRKIWATDISEPLFILGHWRSGTTFLHNLLSQDDRFCFPTTYQTLLPASFLSSEFLTRPITEASLPETRPQDNIELGCDLPQEEEYALGNLSSFSFYNAWCFPRGKKRYHEYTLLDEQVVSAREIKSFKWVYDYFLHKVVFAAGGNKQVVVKNPSNTARIKLLLELYPDARFVNIHRDPVTVVLSTVRMMLSELPGHTLQKPPKDFDPMLDVLQMYQAMHEKYFKEVSLIDSSRFVDVEYDDLKFHPVETMKHIYSELGYENFSKLKPVFEKYVKGLGTVKTASYSIDEDVRLQCLPYVEFAAKKWGYEVA